MSVEYQLVDLQLIATVIQVIIIDEHCWVFVVVGVEF
jgi:hypothetical protein